MVSDRLMSDMLNFVVVAAVGTIASFFISADGESLRLCLAGEISFIVFSTFLALSLQHRRENVRKKVASAFHVNREPQPVRQLTFLMDD